ncbi:bifunctional uridylyltransferase/uridylyl-removing protein GlnD [Nitratidesulfovibrio sp. 1201_IL3209]|uniref:bifunctional uridylyltransferase/uridylyl-removing protein GlnD n=1 Tax=Nitratidesulfovibrio sp. 1201_IL3209 TaxID=3084053 RepID=UPI002FDB5F09
MMQAHGPSSSAPAGAPGTPRDAATVLREGRAALLGRLDAAPSSTNVGTNAGADAGAAATAAASSPEGDACGLRPDARCRDTAPAPTGASRFERAYSRLLDDYFRLRFAELRGGHDKVALVAVGGYGREELCLGSDIDILILCGRSIPPQAIDLAQPLFLPLWDAGYTLGHGFRTIGDCVKLAAKDHKVLASLLDARLITGNEALFRELVDRLNDKVLPRRGASFLAWNDEEHERRRAAHGDGAVLLEPNLKEGLGGLRDYHRILWIGRIRNEAGTVEEILAQSGFSASDAALLRESVGFLHDVRNLLHHLSHRKNDQLFLDLQPEIAARLGFRECGNLLAVECFLGRLHRCMSHIKALSAALRGIPGGPVHPDRPCPEVEGPVVMAGGTLHICLPDPAAVTPGLALSAFVRAAEWPGPEAPAPDWNTRKAMEQALQQALSGEAGALSGAEVGAALMRILASGKAFPVLGHMDETGLLPAILPAYAAARDRVQFDGFHTYPVGMHTLFVIRQLESLAGEDVEPFSGFWRGGCLDVADAGECGAVNAPVPAPVPEQDADAARDRLCLLLAALLHDLGKGGADASHHSEAGAEMAMELLTEWGAPSEVVDDVVFLVLHHLLLIRTAQRRDLNDESVVAQCAGTVGSLRRLNMLYLLTHADSMATGHKAWNRWTASLLYELHGKVANMLRDGQLAGTQTAQAIVRTRDMARALVRERQPSLHYTPETAGLYLDAMPSRYLLAMPPEDIVRHMSLVYQLNRDVAESRRRLPEDRAERGVIVLEGRPLHGGRDSELWEVLVAARDQSGLFATIAGVLSLHGLNVLGADAYVWSDGTVLDVFHVTAPPDPLYARDFWGKVRGAIHFALTGKLSLDYRLEQARASNALKHEVPSVLLDAVRRPPEVRIDNELSDFHTVVEVFAPDRPALLYDVARVLQALQLDILFAKIATLGNRTSDSFSVRTVYGQKITDEQQMDEVRAALLHVVS